jgi:hypothetical protein
MGKPIDANPTQTILDWSQIDWRKIERVVLRLQHRIFMAKVKGDVKGMESLQRLLASSRAAKLLAIRKVGQENSGRKTPGIDGVVSNSDRDRVRLFQDGLSLKDYAAAPVRRVYAQQKLFRQRHAQDHRDRYRRPRWLNANHCRGVPEHTAAAERLQCDGF